MLPAAEQSGCGECGLGVVPVVCYLHVQESLGALFPGSAGPSQCDRGFALLVAG